jgi:hypothetical protein
MGAVFVLVDVAIAAARIAVHATEREGDVAVRLAHAFADACYGVAAEVDEPNLKARWVEQGLRWEGATCPEDLSTFDATYLTSVERELAEPTLALVSDRVSEAPISGRRPSPRVRGLA